MDYSLLLYFYNFCFQHGESGFWKKKSYLYILFSQYMFFMFYGDIIFLVFDME